MKLQKMNARRISLWTTIILAALVMFTGRTIANAGLTPVCESNQTSEFHAFMVVARYYRSEFEVGGNSLNDVQELRQLMISLGVTPDNITILYDGAVPFDCLPTRENIEAQYRIFLDGLSEESIAFCYFSGFGFDDSEERCFFAPIDYRFDKSSNDSALSVNDMIDQLSASKARYKFFCFDFQRAYASDVLDDIVNDDNEENAGYPQERVNASFLDATRDVLHELFSKATSRCDDGTTLVATLSFINRRRWIEKILAPCSERSTDLGITLDPEVGDVFFILAHPKEGKRTTFNILKR